MSEILIMLIGVCGLFLMFGMMMVLLGLVWGASVLFLKVVATLSLIGAFGVIFGIALEI